MDTLGVTRASAGVFGLMAVAELERVSSMFIGALAHHMSSGAGPDESTTGPGLVSSLLEAAITGALDFSGEDAGGGSDAESDRAAVDALLRGIVGTSDGGEGGDDE